VEVEASTLAQYFFLLFLFAHSSGAHQWSAIYADQLGLDDF
jgi:hypothetical protein